MPQLTELIYQLHDMVDRPKIGLALAGGGAYGIAHVGVLKVLEDIQLPIDIVVGTSAGSIAGAFWVSGISGTNMARLARRTEWWFLAKPVAFKSGLMSSHGIEQWVSRVTHNKGFQDLQKKFAATATDFSTGELVILDSGNLAKAVRTSCTIPGIYQPVDYDGRLLVDGGVVQNLPAQTCKALGADLVIGVDLHSNLVESDTPTNVVMSLIHAANILQRQHELIQLQAVDVVIEPKVGVLSQVNFKAIDKFIEIGIEAGQQSLTQLEIVLAGIVGG